MAHGWTVTVALALLATACTVKHVTVPAAADEGCPDCQEPPPEVDEPDAKAKADASRKDASSSTNDDEDPPAPPPTVPCSKSPNAKGVVERNLLGGRFYTYVPPSYDPQTPVPLVVALHGAGDTGKGYLSFEWQANADTRGFVVLAVEGLTTFSAGFTWTESDRARVMAALDDARACYAIKPNKTILQGFSVGADMALFVGLTYSSDFDGIAVASGSLGRAETAFNAGTPLSPATHKMPITLWRGTSDPIVPLTEITDTQTRLQTAGHAVSVHSFKGAHKTAAADALAQYDELVGPP